MCNRILSISLVVGMLCLSSLQGFAQGKKWALLIGIEEYDRAEISTLKYAVKDVNAVARSLENLGYEPANIRTMTSAIKDANDPNRPTNDNVIGTLERLAKSVQPGDSFLFYFTGHGFTKENENFLASVNANPTSANTLKRSAIPLADLQQAMKNFKAKQILFVIDACRNDPEAGKGDADNKLTDEFSKSLVLASRAAQAGSSGVLFACSNGERAFEDAQKEHSVFTYYLLEALSGKTASTGPLAMADVVKYVRIQVEVWATEHGKKQTPELLPKEANTMVLADKILHAVENALSADSRQPSIALKRLTNPQDGAEMLQIPAGVFLMGDDDTDNIRSTNPRHTEKTESYYIYKYPVTVKQYLHFCSETGHTKPKTPSWGWRQDDPVVNVSWDDAQAYCKWASQKGVPVRLPTEKEWEKAARGTQGLLYPWGDSWDANNCVNASTSKRRVQLELGTESVYSHQEGMSPFSVMHMAGNVSQWCADYYDATQHAHALRGGNWINGLEFRFRTGYRLNFDSFPPTDLNLSAIGFRCASGL